jgi:hypothetical protein
MNRWLTQFRLQQEKRVIDVFAKVAIGSSGAATLSAVNSKGVVSVTHNATGRYTFVFGTNTALPLDTFVKVLHVHAVFNTVGASVAAPAAPIPYIYADNVAVAGTCSITIQFVDYAGAAADPANGEIMYINFCMGDSTAP